MGVRLLAGVRVWPLAAALTLAAGPAWAQPASRAPTRFALAPATDTPADRTFGDDMTAVWDAFTHTLSAPSRWEREDWLTVAAVTGVTAGSVVVEENVRAAIQRNRSGFGDALERVGFWYGTPYVTIPASLLTYGAGAAFNSNGVRDTGLMMMDVLLLVGLVQQPLRMIAGRARPERGGGHLDFDPLTTSNSRASFVSGHAWSAFGISNVVARQIDQGWAYTMFFALAGITAWSRLYADKHWLSDVILGGALGYFTSTTVWKWFRDQEMGGIAEETGGPLLRVTLRF